MYFLHEKEKKKAKFLLCMFPILHTLRCLFIVFQSDIHQGNGVWAQLTTASSVGSPMIEVMVKSHMGGLSTSIVF